MDPSREASSGCAGHVAELRIAAGAGAPTCAIDEATLIAGHGIDGDLHAGNQHRQVSLLAAEVLGQQGAVNRGAEGANILTRGFELGSLRVGQRFRVGGQAVLQVTEIGRECGPSASVGREVEACLMRMRGVFARVRRGGTVRRGAAVDLDRALDVLRYAVLPVSDRGAAGERADRSGAIVCQMLEEALGGSLLEKRVLPDERDAIRQQLTRLCDEEICDLVVTTGGTGLSPRDVTPEATRDVIEREIPGMAEAMRAAGMLHTPHAMLSRAVCGIRGATIVVNLAGSPKAVREQLVVLLPALPHAIQTAAGIPQDCGQQ